jgi:hypothetical protein
MNDIFENQKEKLLAIKHEISLLHQQVNYLLRNEKPLGLLDLDVLMNRTHTVYDLLCSINLGENGDDEEMDIDSEAFSSLFAPMMQGNEDTEEKVETPAQEEPAEPVVNVENAAEETPASVPEEVTQEEPEEETLVLEEEPVEVTTPQPVESEAIDFNPEPEKNPEGDELGLFFRFEDVLVQEEEKPEETTDDMAVPTIEEELTIEEPAVEEELTIEEPTIEEPTIEEEPEVEEVVTVEESPAAVEERVVHFVEEIPEEEIPERDLVDGESLVRDNPFEMPKMEHENKGGAYGTETGLWDMKPEEIEHSAPSEYEDVFKRDDTEFEMATGETLGEKMMGEDHSLAAKLQQAPTRDLKSAIGINDKFLFVNELFGGSMEKYNKSIENLNDLKTLNGAMIYLNELKIELQWNSSNEAYQKLKDLVSRKFES